MNREEVVLSNVLAIIIILSLGIFKVSSEWRRLDYWLNSKYLHVQSFLQTIK
jgi:hypothetical protein